MKRALGNALTIAVIVLLPLLLGALIVGPETPVGRNTRSPTRVGHKALFLLFEELGYEVRRFERGVETLPDGGSILIALEPGPALFRNEGAFAKNLLTWIERGNAALVTLGPDPDRPAELDDREGELGARAKQAIEIAERIRDRAKDDAPKAPVEPVAEREVPNAVLQQRELETDESWDSGELTAFLGLAVLEDRLSISSSSTISLEGSFVSSLGGNASLAITRPRVWLPIKAAENAREYRVLASAGDRPLLLEIAIGRGKLLVLSEPRLFHNAVISRASHARLAVRVIEYLASTTQRDVVLFEEFSHGGREARSVIDLTLHTRARWPVLQVLLLVLAWIMMVAWRNRSVVPFEAMPRRSRDEVIDAMASLFLRASDTKGAASRMIELSRRRLLAVLPAGAEAELVPLIATRLQRDSAEIAAALDPSTVASAKDLVERAELLRALRVAAEAQK